MSLADLVKQELKDFNPATDNPNQSEARELPAGEFDAVVDNIQFQVYDSGYEAFVLVAKVVTGEHADQKEIININLDPGYVTKKGMKLYEKYPNLLTQNIKLVSQLAYATDTELQEDDWQDMVTLADAFVREGAKGKQFILEVEKTTSKAGKEYTNYSFARYEDNPFDGFEEEVPF